MTPRRALWGLVVLSGLLRLYWAASLGVGNDEAYYYLFTVHPDWSYYDHPPMLAVIEGLGLSLAGGAVSAFALRLGFVGLFAGSTLLIARIARRFYGDWAGVLAAFVLNATGFFGVAVGTFALPDGPLLFFWLLTLDRLACALERPARNLRWVGVGLAWGGAMLSKYHAILLPAGALLYVALHPPARVCLRRRGPYLAVITGLIVFGPVVAWNATHGWASFAFQGGRALGDVRLRPELLLASVAGQALYVFPWIWLPLVGVLAKQLHGIGVNEAKLVVRNEDEVPGTAPAAPERDFGVAADRFLLAQSVLPLGGFLLLACFREVLPHWSLVGYLPLMPMLGQVWARRWVIDPRRLRRRLAMMAAVPSVLAVVAILQVRMGLLQEGAPRRLGVLPVSRDPSVDLYGWDAVARELRARGLVNRPGTFLFTSKWYHSGQLAFALGGEGPVLCYSPSDPHGFGHWSQPGDWVGRDGILVVVNDSSTEPAAFDRWFETIDSLGDFNVDRAGETVRTVHLYRCVRQTKPFPFDGSRAGTARARVVSNRPFGDNRWR